MPRSTGEGGESTRGYPLEERGHRVTEPPEGKVPGTASPDPTSTKLRRIAELVEAAQGRPFTSLAHFIDVDWLREAYWRTRKSGAPGVDGQTAEEYAANLEENLQSLLDRAKSGHYRAPPVRRVHIPKGDGRSTRPLGIPTFEDKVLQRAVKMAVEPLYEPEFHPGSYGFRPGRSVHGALDELWRRAMEMHGCWILEVDIRKYFDTLDHGRLLEILRHKVRDGVILRLIGKWLNAGVQEQGQLSYPETGTPQGGVISPLLSNIYLHEVLDTWFEAEVKPRLQGRAFLIRYADDFVIGFEQEADARKVMEVLPKRFGRFGLTLHPDKTRLVPFHQPRPKGWRGRDDRPPPVTFDLLGFTHHWEKTRRGTWVLTRTTMTARLTRALDAVRQWCRANRHLPIRSQREVLAKKLMGHYQFYGLADNLASLWRYSRELFRIWWKWLARRSQKVDWKALSRATFANPLPAPPPRANLRRPRRLAANL